ncbi:MAG: response regulator [Candidatus Cohnella colombiensis]|uniref:Response regulator n=1 Tax=Candidatus Cohnella colombiensis TaxID=3121368 RepID=A0AA95F1U0_9BACL|nr:MAG: response regulator [Cohnella sp.]
MRLRALIIDDEANILKNLQAIIPWESMDIEIVGTARNGEQALNCAREHHPQLILSDIRMPVMDGIQFLSELRQFDTDALVIMMTGYQDFNYVRSVIRYEVHDYILKPIDYEELSKTIERLADQIRQSYREQQLAQQKWSEVYSLAYEKLLYDHLVDASGSGTRQLMSRDENDSMDRKFAMMLVDVDNYLKRERSWEEKERKLWNYAIHNILQEQMASYPIPYSILQVRSGEWCVLFDVQSQRKFDRQQYLVWGEEIMSAVESYLKIQIRVALHPSSVTIEQLSRIYKSLQRTLNLSVGSNREVIVSDKSKSQSDPTQRLWDRIEEMVTGLKRCDRYRTEAALKALNEGFGQLPESSFERVAPITHYLCLHLLREMRAMDILTNDEEVAIWKQIDRDQGIRETLEVINRLVDQSLENVMKKKTSDVLMLSAKDYIERHLSTELSIDLLADYLGISGSYFSLLFKQYSGETFVEFVTKQRMEMAKSLLALSDKSVTQIGLMVGYLERRYFTKVFSKYSGMLPSEFREKHQKKHENEGLQGWVSAD